jgi:hypothetical protein
MLPRGMVGRGEVVVVLVRLRGAWRRIESGNAHRLSNLEQSRYESRDFFLRSSNNPVHVDLLCVPAQKRRLPRE